MSFYYSFSDLALYCGAALIEPEFLPHWFEEGRGALVRRGTEFYRGKRPSPKNSSFTPFTQWAKRQLHGRWHFNAAGQLHARQFHERKLRRIFHEQWESTYFLGGRRGGKRCWKWKQKEVQRQRWRKWTLILWALFENLGFRGIEKLEFNSEIKPWLLFYFHFDRGAKWMVKKLISFCIFILREYFQILYNNFSKNYLFRKNYCFWNFPHALTLHLWSFIVFLIDWNFI